MEIVRPSCRWAPRVPSETEEACTVKKMLQASICFRRESQGLVRIDLTNEDTNPTKTEYSDEGELQKELRRERNKLSARRCRKRRREERNLLKQEKDSLISGNADLVKSIKSLYEEKQRLESMLLNHNCKVFPEQSVFQDTYTLPPMEYENTNYTEEMYSTPLDLTYIDLNYFI